MARTTKRAPETKSAKTKKEVAKAEENPLAHLDLDMLQEDAGAGMENMGVGDLLMPYLYILQSNSPQVNPGHQSYVEGAQASNLYNVANGRLYDARDAGLTVVFCACERKFVEWRDRDEGGGWVGEHSIDSDILEFCEKDERGRWKLKSNGNNIVETAYHYALYFCPHKKRWEQCVIPMKSTALKVHRHLGNMMAEEELPNGRRAPRWICRFKLTTYLEQKNNNSWWQFHLEKVGYVDKEVYDKARSFYKLVEGGEIERKPETQATTDDEIPF